MKPRCVAAATAGIALVGGAVFALRGVFMAPLADRVLRAAAELSPAHEGDPHWDDFILGGALGAGRWRYFQRGYGTTCGIFGAACFARAGAPAVLINREPPEGSGFVPGQPISRLYQGAQTLGWLRVAGKDAIDLRPGDLYCVHRPGATYQGKPVSPEHVGVVLAVKGEAIATADGGQTDTQGRQCATRNSRKLSGDQLSTVSGPARLAWWIRPGGGS